MKVVRSSELLSIGSELLLGETVDTNAAFLGAELARLGMPLQQVRQLPDDRAVIARAFAEARGRSALVVATGGLGPTHDDLTREGVADALGEELHPDAALLATLEGRYRTYGPMPASNRRQALLIASAEALANPIGSAPGWWVDRDGAISVLMPGVPSEMRRMWAEQVRPRLERRFTLPPLVIRTVKAFGIGESAAAERLGGLLESPAPGVDAGIYARDDGIHVRFSTSADPSSLDACVSDALGLLGDDAYGTDDADLALAALLSLGRAGITTLATRESGTDGALLTILAAAAPADAAARFVGGILALDGDGEPASPAAEAVLSVRLRAQDAHGRSRVEMALGGPVALPSTQLRIHGSGTQRLRRAAFAALDEVRRRVSPSGR